LLNVKLVGASHNQKVNDVVLKPLEDKINFHWDVILRIMSFYRSGKRGTFKSVVNFGKGFEMISTRISFFSLLSKFELI
jgi:hypothetical protein